MKNLHPGSLWTLWYSTLLIVFLLLGSLSGMYAYRLWDKYQQEQTWKTVSAHVLKTESMSSLSGYRWRMQLRYIVSDEPHVTWYESGNPADYQKKMKTVTVYYNPENPDQIQMSLRAPWLELGLLSVFSGLCLLIALVLLRLLTAHHRVSDEERRYF